MTFYSILLKLAYAVYSIAIFWDIIAVFQQCGYSAEKCKKWLNKRKNGLFVRFLICVLPLSFLSVYYELAKFDLSAYIIFNLIAMFVCAYIRICSVKLRIKPKLTARLIRIVTIYALIFSLIGSLFEFLLSKMTWFTSSYSYLFICIFSQLLFLSVAILSPYEKLSRKISVRVCKRNLGKRKDLIKIGVTGSCGKTSVKEFLSVLLSADYKVYATPKSYNTPLGICISAKQMPKDTEVFIAEMGARRRGDIKELTDIVKPRIGIITAIAEQHMETFGSVEVIKLTKNELIEGLESNGFAVFSCDTAGSKALYDKAKCSKISAGENGEEVSWNTPVFKGGRTEFELNLFGKKYKAQTTLLGRHNLTNICLASAVAYRLGVSGERIVSLIKTLKAPRHRLELIKNSNGVFVIDDGYNANIEGVKSAAEAVKLFQGKKYAVTSGIVEGGESGERLNREVGKILSYSVDVLIAVGTNAEAIVSGVENPDCEKLKYKDIFSAKSILASRLKRGDAVIFINDLPDMYL